MSQPDGDSRSAWRTWLVRGAKVLVVLVVAWGVHRTILAALEQLGQHPWRWRPGWLLLSGGLYLLGTFPSACFWHWTMHRLGARPRFWRSVAAYYVGHLGKYVPGKGMVVVLRTSLVRGPQTDLRLAAAAVFYETLTAMATGGALAALLLVTLVEASWLTAALAIGLAAIAAAPTLPPVTRRLLTRLAIRSEPGERPASVELDWYAMGVGWLASGIGWVVLGLSLEAALAAADAQVEPLHDLPLCIASVGLAVVAGFLSFLPGGAVVREAVLMELLVPRFGPAAAVVGAILLRLAWLGAELVTAGVIWSTALVRRDRSDDPAD